VTAVGLQIWTTRTHDCRNGCICTEAMDDRLDTTQVVVNTNCPITEHAREVTSVDFSPNGQRIVSGSYDKLVKIWDAENGAEVHTPDQGEVSIQKIMCHF
jgi:WD40 repeat protein